MQLVDVLHFPLICNTKHLNAIPYLHLPACNWKMISYCLHLLLSSLSMSGWSVRNTKLYAKRSNSVLTSLLDNWIYP